MYSTKMCSAKIPRDFCIIEKCQTQDDGSFIIVKFFFISFSCFKKKNKSKFARSVTHDKCETSPKGFIRGELLESGYLIKKKTPNKSEVSYLVQVDLTGMPTNIINLIADRQPLVIAGLKEYLEKKN